MTPLKLANEGEHEETYPYSLGTCRIKGILYDWADDVEWIYYEEDWLVFRVVCVL